MGSDTLRSITDANGLLNLSLPAPDFTGKGKIVIQLDLESSYEILDRLGPRYTSLRNAIEDDIRTKILEIPYVVTSNARSVPMAVFAVELDAQGKVAGSDTFQSALLDSLTREGYSLRALPLDPALGAGMVDDRILVAARQAAGDSFGRLAYGVARIESVRKDGAFYIVSASGRIKVAEIAGGRILYSADKSWQAVANDEATAIRAAYRELGSRLFGPDLAATLP